MCELCYIEATDRNVGLRLITKEFRLFGIEVTALQERRFEAQGQLQEEDYTFFWVGKTVGPGEAGVAFEVQQRSHPDLCL